MKGLNKFDQLVEDMLSGRINLAMIQMALRVYIKRNPKLPDEIKGLLAGKSEKDTGLIYKMFDSISAAIGSVELAFRRGRHE